MLSDMIKSALARFVAEQTGESIVEVTSFDSETREMGGCDTCSYTTTVIEVTYNTPTRYGRLFEYTGDFADLISALDRLTVDQCVDKD